VMEGAGSPAEINLADCDMTNLRAAELADAAVLMVCDIDRGGAFAHLYGTWALLEPEQRERIGGFVLNKFRGDPGLLPPAPERLRELTGVPLAGVVPWIRHGLPDEDGITPPRPTGAPGRPRVEVVAYPAASNLDELKPLEQVCDLRFRRRPEELGAADLLVLPGSKHVAADLRWLREAGFERPMRDRLAQGARLLGICGGMQMLGEELRDKAGVDGSGEGLGLLPLATAFEPEKTVRRVEVELSGELDGSWAPLAGRRFAGYEIRHGRTSATGPAREAAAGGLGWVAGNVLGIAVHGLFENPQLAAALFGTAPRRTLDADIDALADEVVAGLDVELVERLVAVRPGAG
jgi:adenosylcobyric acid synthase